jgi:hypothetical protein
VQQARDTLGEVRRRINIVPNGKDEGNSICRYTLANSMLVYPLLTDPINIGTRRAILADDQAERMAIRMCQRHLHFLTHFDHKNAG